MSALNSLNIDWTGGPEVPKWSHSYARDTMGQAGHRRRRGVGFAGRLLGRRHRLRRIARPCRPTSTWPIVVRDDPDHFGGFATMPLPDVDASLRELEYSYDTLGLDGVVLFTSQGDRYLGDPLYDPFFEELERRNADRVHPSEHDSAGR